MKTQPLRRTVRTAFVLLFTLVLLVPFVGAQSPSPSGEREIEPAVGATNPSDHISDSPRMHTPEDLGDWPPMLPPEPRDLEGVKIEDPEAVVSYDIATGTTVQTPSGDPTQAPAEPGLRSTPPYSGLLPQGIGIETVFPPDDRARVSPTTSFPWRTVVRLFITFPSEAGFSCSGVIIGCPNGHGYEVLTTGHCIYSQANGGWATSILVVPGLDGSYWPFNYAWATGLRSYTGWTQYQLTEHDWGLVALDRNVGDYTGWMGRMTAAASDPVYTTVVNTAGYPCSSYDATSCPYPVSPSGSMWFDADNGNGANDFNHWYFMDTQSGQSGSPIWLLDQGNRYIMTIHTTSDDGSGSNHGTRLDQDKFDRIITWCNADPSPTDYADLIDDGRAWSGFDPTAVRPGSTSFHAWSDVRNAGTADSGGFYVQYRASLDTTCSTGDFLIGTDYIGGIAPFTWADSDWTGTFPSGLPDGTYYLCWIIDSGGNVPEFREDDNTAYLSSPRLYVGVQPTKLYVPFVSRRLFQDPGEPNDSFEQAWGPLASGQTYNGFFPTESDTDDWYYFNQGATHSIESWLTNIPCPDNDYDLYLYDSNLERIGYSGEQGCVSGHIFLGSRPAGKYYLRVRRAQGISQTQPYALQVVYR